MPQCCCTLGCVFYFCLIFFPCQLAAACYQSASPTHCLFSIKQRPPIVYTTLRLKGGRPVVSHLARRSEAYSEWDSESSITPDSEEDQPPQKQENVDRMMMAEEILPNIPGLRGLGIKVRVPKVVNGSSQELLAKELCIRAINRGVEMSDAERLAFVRKARDEGIISSLVKDGDVPASFADCLDEEWDELPIIKRERAVHDEKTLRKMYLGDWSRSDQAGLDELVEAAQSKMKALDLPLQVPDVVSTVPAAVGTSRGDAQSSSTPARRGLSRGPARAVRV
jgi:hypothetical protein